MLPTLAGPAAPRGERAHGRRPVHNRGVDDESWMRLALAEAARAGAAGEVPVGAVLARGGELLAAGFNQPIAASDPTAHAEIVALRQAARAAGNYRLPGATLYVSLEPCLMCVGALVLARVARVVYAAAEPKFGALESLTRAHELPLNHRLEVQGGLLAEESRALLLRFFRARR
jgi:tRNA(adenine34) deaminase